MKITGIQFDLKWEEKSPNHERVRELLAEAAPEPGSLVVLPEMFASGFSMNAAAIDDTETGETRDFLSRTARESGIYLQAGLVRRNSAGRPANQSIVFDPEGTEVARYEKIFPFTPGGESAAYAAGDRISLYEWGGFTVASFICYDLRFPEIFRLAAARGATLYTVIASWPEARTSHWMTLLQARAIENQAYVIGVNRCGRDPYLGYSGRSLIIDPLGAILADGGSEDGAITAELDREALDQYRERLPFLRDMRTIAG